MAPNTGWHREGNTTNDTFQPLAVPRKTGGDSCTSIAIITANNTRII